MTWCCSMTIQLTPEDEKLIQKRLQSGTFHSIEEVIHDALAAQDSEAEWLSDQQESINAKTARGIAQLDPGQGICRGGRARTACSSARLSGRTNKRVDGHVNSVAGGRSGSVFSYCVGSGAARL